MNSFILEIIHGEKKSKNKGFGNLKKKKKIILTRIYYKQIIYIYLYCISFKILLNL